jgi:hypothetical protein
VNLVEKWQSPLFRFILRCSLRPSIGLTDVLFYCSPPESLLSVSAVTTLAAAGLLPVTAASEIVLANTWLVSLTLELSCQVALSPSRPFPSFLQIAGFIFGKNNAAGAEGAEKVAMTTPVQLEMREGGASEKIAMTTPVAAEMSDDGSYKVGLLRGGFPHGTFLGFPAELEACSSCPGRQEPGQLLLAWVCICGRALPCSLTGPYSAAVQLQRCCRLANTRCSSGYGYSPSVPLCAAPPTLCFFTYCASRPFRPRSCGDYLPAGQLCDALQVHAGHAAAPTQPQRGHQGDACPHHGSHLLQRKQPQGGQGG